MPKSKVRKKNDYTVNPANRTPVKVKMGPSSTLYVSVMLGVMSFIPLVENSCGQPRKLSTCSRMNFIHSLVTTSRR